MTCDVLVTEFNNVYVKEPISTFLRNLNPIESHTENASKFICVSPQRRKVEEQ